MVIPVNIVMGGLGVGKTTTLAHIIHQKPAEERWAVVVNEFGALGIDGALLEAAATSTDAQGVTVRELAGGCMCCTLSGPLAASIAQLVRRVRPDRLLMEPSGLGHAASLIDVLTGEHLRTALHLQAVVCLVDPEQLAAVQESELLSDQVQVADILVGNKQDMASPQAMAAFRSWAEGLYPPKQTVLCVSRGRLDLEVLRAARTQAQLKVDADGNTGAHASAAEAGGPEHEHLGQALGSSLEAVDLESLRPGQLYRKEGRRGSSHAACGWLMHRDDICDGEKLLQLLQLLWSCTARVKGVIRTRPKRWVQPVVVPQSQGRSKLALETIAHRSDSRLEVIAGPKLPSLPAAPEADHHPACAEAACSIASGLQQAFLALSDAPPSWIPAALAAATEADDFLDGSGLALNDAHVHIWQDLVRGCRSGDLPVTMDEEPWTSCSRLVLHVRGGNWVVLEHVLQSLIQLPAQGVR